ncbi:MAG: TGS domain-containing protein [Nitrososphaeria archaeon]
MVTNLPAKSKALWAKAMLARNPKEKLELLKQFYSSFPKHKATERLEMQLKRQMKGLEEEIERGRKKHGTVVNIWSIKKSGELQLAIIGRLDEAIEYFRELTNKKIEIFDVYTRPNIGTMKINFVILQVILCPFDDRLSDDRQKKIGSLLYNIDLLLVILPEKEPVKYLSDLISWLTQYNITLTSRKREAKIEHTGTGGIRIVGKSRFCIEEQIKQFLFEYKITDGIVKISEETTLEDVEAVVFGQINKPALILCKNQEQEALMRSSFTIIPSMLLTFEKNDLLNRILGILGLIRIYTKGRGSQVAERPILVRKGANVVEVAKIIHNKMAENFMYAKLWRGRKEIKVGRNFVLEDGDVIEIRSK